MITLTAFLAGIQSIVNEKPAYQNGMDGRNKQCDCIGLIIGAIRRQGGTWTGTHGSNWAARNAMQSLVKSPQLGLGAVLYKASEPGSASWDLPDSYAGHPDQRDYYHVGVVTQVSPLQITHCTSWSGGSGIKVDTTIGKWLYGGRLKMVSYDTETGGSTVATGANTAQVCVPGGGTARIRTEPNDKALILANVRDGAIVDNLEQKDGWWKISSGGKVGWMMSKYLLADGEPSAEPNQHDGDIPTQEVLDRAALVNEASNIVERLGAILKLL